VSAPWTLGIVKTVNRQNWKSWISSKSNRQRGSVGRGWRSPRMPYGQVSDSRRRRGVSPSSRRSVPALARGFRICATLQLLAPPSKQAPARGRLWPQARGAGLRGNLMGVSGVLPRLLGRSVLAAKMGMLWRRRWLKSSQLPPSPVSLPAVLRRGW